MVKFIWFDRQKPPYMQDKRKKKKNAFGKDNVMERGL